MSDRYGRDVRWRLRRELSLHEALRGIEGIVSNLITTDERYAWMTKHIVICTGQREPATVTLQFYKVA